MLLFLYHFLKIDRSKNHLGRLLCIQHSLRQLLDELCVQGIHRSLVHAESGNAVGISLNGDLGAANGGGAEVGWASEASTQTQCQPSAATQRRHVVKSERFWIRTNYMGCIVGSFVLVSLRLESISCIFDEGYPWIWHILNSN